MKTLPAASALLLVFTAIAVWASTPSGEEPQPVPLQRTADSEAQDRAVAPGADINDELQILPDPLWAQQEPEEQAVVPQPGTLENGRYTSPDLQFSFSLPEGWTLVEVPRPGRHLRTSANAPLQILLSSESGDLLGISIFWTGETEIENWVPRYHASSIEEGMLDYNLARGFLSGHEAYMWKVLSTTGQDGNGYILLALVGENVYQFEFSETLVSPSDIKSMIESVVIGDPGQTKLPINIVKDTLKVASAQRVQSCSNCTDVDSYSNTYPCCTTHGNCTWKCEQLRSGSDNFRFGGSGRDAYRWMTLSRTYNSYAQGGTVPSVGAVLVAIKSYGGVGHVATVTSVGADGSVRVSEQNCGATCTRTQSYSLSWLRTNLAGYIYTGSAAPSCTPKAIASSGETIIEDHNSSNVYNFLTVGPGSYMSFNAGERAWGTSNAGRTGFMHFMKSKAGSSENYARWCGQFQAAGDYELQVWVPNSTYSGATNLRYEVGIGASLLATSRINQSANRNKWVKLVNPARQDGLWKVSAPAQSSVYVRDNSNSVSSDWIAMDAIKWIRRS